MTPEEIQRQIDAAWSAHNAAKAEAAGQATLTLKNAKPAAMWINTKAAAPVAPQDPETTLAIGDRCKWPKYYGPIKTGTVIADNGSGRRGAMKISFDGGGEFLVRIAE